eukprot:359735-Chlamydomonas_euryale.AAC.1
MAATNGEDGQGLVAQGQAEEQVPHPELAKLVSRISIHTPSLPPPKQARDPATSPTSSTRSPPLPAPTPLPPWTAPSPRAWVRPPPPPLRCHRRRRCRRGRLTSPPATPTAQRRCVLRLARTVAALGALPHTPHGHTRSRRLQRACVPRPAC